MSLPTFPENCLDLTKDQAFTMLLGSIAMEELALSHIMNAEGEKLQYVLGTLPGCHKPCSTPTEILEVNRSISDLLDRVTQSQLLLKGKLAQVLDAMKLDPPCVEEKSICILCSSTCIPWSCDTPLAWNPVYTKGSLRFWKQCCPFNLYLSKKIPFLLSYSFQLEAVSSPVVLVLKVLQDGFWKEIMCCEAPKSTDPINISGSTIIGPEHSIVSPLVFTLKKPAQITLRQAMITFIEL